MPDYSSQPKLLKCDQPFLHFQMPLDGGLQSISGINTGRLSLWDYKHGYIHRWVVTSSSESKQGVGDWDVRGGVHPPNYAMDGAEWFQMDTKLILQPGCPVPEGYLPKYKGGNTWTTLKGNVRSEIMVHCDDNYKTARGSMGCIVFLPDEWNSFKKVITDCCSHIPSIPYGVVYS